MADLIISQPMTFTVDVKTGIVERPQRESLMRGDKYANRIIVELVDGSETFDITGVTVKGEFCKPPNGDSIDLPGEAKGNVAEVQLTDQCYTAGGHYEARVILVLGEVERTVLFISGDVLKSGSGNEAGEEPGGEPGGTGSGLPAGGTAGQVLVKVSSAQGAAIWKTLTAEDVGARPNTWTPTAEDVGARPDTWTPTAEETGALPSDGTAKDSEKLGGQMPEHYASAESVSRLSQQITTLDSAKLGKTEQAADSAKLGGVAADQYALKTDVPENTGGASEGLISDEYSANKTYNSGDYCIFDNSLYKCKEDNVMGIEPTNATYWASVSVMEEMTLNNDKIAACNISVNNQSTSDVKVALLDAITAIKNLKNVSFPLTGNVVVAYYGDTAFGTFMAMYDGNNTAFRIGNSTINKTTTYMTMDSGETWRTYTD